MLFLLLPAGAFAGDVVVGGIVQPQIAIDLPPLQRANGFFAEDKVESHTWARGFASGELPRGDRWFLEARVQYHLLFGDTTTDGWWDAGLGDSGWDGKVAGPLRLRVGMLTERWGQLDLLPVADVLNPRDLRTGLQTPLEFQRTPIPMAIASIGSGAIRSETIFMPVSVADRAFLRDTDWSLSRQRFTENLVKSLDSWDNSTEHNVLFDNVFDEVQGQTPQFRRNLDQAVGQTALPESLIVNAEIAERVEISAGSANIGLMGGWMRSRTPQTVVNEYFRGILQDCADFVPLDDTECGPFATDDTTTTGTGGQANQDELLNAVSEGVIAFTWPRTAVAGADFSTVVGPIALRADALFQSKKPVRMRWGDGTSVPQFGAGVGFDYVRGSNFVLTVESRWLHLFDPPADLILTTPDQVQVAGGVRWSASNAWTFQLGGAYDFTFSEYLATPTVTWRATDNVQVDLSALLLGGGTPVPQDLFDTLRYEGGPLSYFGQNDVATLSVSFIR